MKITTRIALLHWQANPADPTVLWRLIIAWITPGMREPDEKKPIDRTKPIPAGREPPMEGTTKAPALGMKSFVMRLWNE